MAQRQMPEKRPESFWDPMEELQNIQQRLSRIMGEMNMPMAGSLNVQTPDVDVVEKGNNVVVTADMAGLSKNDIHIDVREGNILEISAERRMEHEKEEKGFIRHERGYTRFFRSVRLPAEVDKSKAKATYNNGVLEITLPMTEKAKAKGIPVS